MKITIEGTKSELETAKQALESVCCFDSDHCMPDLSCEECEKQHLEIVYVQKIRVSLVDKMAVKYKNS